MIKNFGSKKFTGHSDDDSGTEHSAKKLPISVVKAVSKSYTADTLGGDGVAPMVIDRSKSKVKVKVPAHLMKKYSLANSKQQGQQGQSPAPPRGGGGVNNRKPLPPIAPPPGPPPSSAFRSSEADRKLE